MTSWNDKTKARAAEAGKRFADFVETIARLRHPKTGCPWDLKQTHESLRRYMLEEAYEASEAMGSGDERHMAEELGDVLLQVVLNAQLGDDHGRWSIEDVIEGIDSKMKRRHPHVFDADNVKAGSAEEVLQQWSAIKAKEKGAAKRLFDEEKSVFPSLQQAYRIGEKAEKIAFDWDNVADVFAQLESEMAELKAEMVKRPREPAALRAELGDVFFTLAQLCRHLGLDPETVAQDGNRKFLKRFAQVEDLAQARGLDLVKASTAEKERLWQEAKRLQQPQA